MKGGEWHAIYVLTSGNRHGNLLISACKANTVHLSSLMEVCSPKEWTEWGEKLVIDLIQRRIPLASLDPNGKHPLHAALKMAIKTGKIKTS